MVTRRFRSAAMPAAALAQGAASTNLNKLSQEVQVMSAAARKIPGPDHPITIEPAAGRIVVVAGGRPLADTHRALVLKEASYPPVVYVPRSDTDMSRLTPTDRHTYGPYKGDASYLSIADLGAAGVNAVWSYEAPYDAVAPIAGHLAFYTDKVDRIEEHPAEAPS
jgi:uncharacterized protein (DUF427 family)